METIYKLSITADKTLSLLCKELRLNCGLRPKWSKINAQKLSGK